jgi:hypothetical protein
MQKIAQDANQKQVDKLTKDLKSDDPAAREAAEKQLEQIAKLAKDQKVREQANQALAQIPGRGDPKKDIANVVPEDQHPGLADAKNRLHANELQLENFKKLIDKNILKDANMSEEELKEFMKQFEKKIEQDKTAIEEGKLPDNPDKSGRESVKKFENGDPKKSGPNYGTAGSAPPEFRDSFNRKPKTPKPEQK